jgi:hypothetical protein
MRKAQRRRVDWICNKLGEWELWLQRAVADWQTGRRLGRETSDSCGQWWRARLWIARRVVQPRNGRLAAVETVEGERDRPSMDSNRNVFVVEASAGSASKIGHQQRSMAPQAGSKMGSGGVVYLWPSYAWKSRYGMFLAGRASQADRGGCGRRQRGIGLVGRGKGCGSKMHRSSRCAAGKGCIIAVVRLAAIVEDGDISRWP